MNLNLAEQSFAEDYGTWDKYYNYMLVAFYVTRISKQCSRFKKQFPHNVNWQSLYTDKFVLTVKSNRATMGRNVTDTHFVEDTYYNIARHIYNNVLNDINEEEMRQYLINNNRSKKKPFAMQWIIGAIEASNEQQFNECIRQISSIHWNESNW
jgi:hypothetical protein